jgi:4a-hydroxytetrahydrobiopterin dehydratase
MNGNDLGGLADRNCLACFGFEPQLSMEEARRLADQLPGWDVVRSHHVTRAFDFPDFRQALEFVDQIGAIAEQQGHHPDIELAWGKVGVKIYTHKVQGLTESDFILAAKIERTYQQRPPSPAGN